MSEATNGAITIDDYYLELVPDDLHHAFAQHSAAKQDGDIDVSREDFKKIPEYLDNFDELLYAIKYSSGKVSVCVSKELSNGRMLIIETVSKSRGALQLKNVTAVCCRFIIGQIRNSRIFWLEMSDYILERSKRHTIDFRAYISVATAIAHITRKYI